MKTHFISLLASILIMPLFSISQGFLEQPVPVDQAMRIGKLENGLTYYIRHNEEPKERASFYIIQNVGALLEDDSQNGLAHFLEHMAFNGTKHFPGKGIVNSLEKHGVAFGRNINAYTAFNETVYNLSDVPVKHPGLVDSCLLILNDWSNFLLLTEEEIDAERGVISEEWRTRRNADFRMRSKYFPVLFKDSKFAERDVIGDLDIIKNFEPETLRKFYHDWYRTDLQAIAIVGDIDVDEVESKVIELFSKIRAIENAQPRPFFEVPEHNETRYTLATDKEAAQYQVDIYIKHKGTEPDNKNLNYLREEFVSSLFNSMIAARISELLQKGKPQFINGAIGHSSFIRGYDIVYVSVTAKPNQTDIGLRAAYTEAQRIVKHGFVASELGRAKANLLTAMENAYKQRDKISNDNYAGSIKNHFLKGEPLTSAEFDWDFGQKILETISLEEVSAKAKEWIVPDNRVIVVKGPEGDDAKYITEDEAKALLLEVENADIEPYEDSVGGASLISEELSGSKVVSTKRIDQFNAVEWKLANNATVVFRHADFEKDNVALQAFSFGGSSKFDNDKVPTSIMLSEFAGAFGAGDFDAISLKKMLAGKKAGINISLGGLSESFSGGSTPKDFETMMQLLYLKFSKPRFDEEAFQALKSRYIPFLTNMANDPNKIMQDSTQLIFSNYHPRLRLLNTELFDDISFELMEDLYTDRFTDVGDFTFLIVGNIEEEVAKEMAIKYIGSLEDDQREETWTDHMVRGPKGRTEKEIEIPLQTKKSNVLVRFNKEMDYNPADNLKLNVLKGILTLRYTEEIREKEGGTYGVSVSASSRHFPVAEKTIQMSFDTDPEKAKHLKSLVYKEIDKIVAEGPLAEDLDKVVKNLKKNREQAKQHNSYWLSSIYSYYYHGFNNDAKENFEDVLDGLTVKKMQKFASAFFDSADIIDIIFKPKEE